MGAEGSKQTFACEQMTIDQTRPDGIKEPLAAQVVPVRRWPSRVAKADEEQVATAQTLTWLGSREGTDSVLALLRSENATWMTGHAPRMEPGTTLTGGV